MAVQLITLIQQDVYALLSAEYGDQFGDKLDENTPFPFLIINSWTWEADRTKDATIGWVVTMQLASVTGREEFGHEIVTDMLINALNCVVLNAKGFPLADESEGETIGVYQVDNVFSPSGNSNRGNDEVGVQWTASAVITFNITKRRL